MSRPSNFDLYTGDKTSELTIYYNLALERIKKFLLREGTGQTWDNIFSKNAPQSMQFSDLISDGTYIKLKNYLWKGYEGDKNSEGTLITDQEKNIIYGLLLKLDRIRNFQSHVFHTNEPLRMTGDLKVFLLDIYSKAKHRLSEKYPRELV